MDTEACPVATSVKDASGMPLSICPATDMATYTDDGSGYLCLRHRGHDRPRCAHHGPPDAPSSASSLVDAAISCASPVDAMAALTPLTLTTDMALASS